MFVEQAALEISAEADRTLGCRHLRNCHTK